MASRMPDSQPYAQQIWSCECPESRSIMKGLISLLRSLESLGNSKYFNQEKNNICFVLEVCPGSSVEAELDEGNSNENPNNNN